MWRFGRWLWKFLCSEYRGQPNVLNLDFMMLWQIVVPLSLLSAFNHQEPRFLLPLIVPVLLIAAPTLSKEFGFLKLQNVWCACNIALIIFFGFVHQAGVYPLARSMAQELRIKPAATELHLITTHTYSMPLHFINARSFHVTDFEAQKWLHPPRDFYYHDYGSSKAMDIIVDQIKLMAFNCKRRQQASCKYYLALPNSLREELNMALNYTKALNVLNVAKANEFFPHLSVEAPPHFAGMHSCTDYPAHWWVPALRPRCYAQIANPLLRLIFAIRQQLSLSVYVFEAKPSVQEANIQLPVYA